MRVPGGLRVTGVGGGRASAGTVCWTASLHPNTYGVFTIALTLGSSVSAGHVALSATAQIGRSDRLRATTTITIT